MEEDKIPTFAEFKIQKYKELGRVLSDDQLAIEFAKMHVKKALDEVNKNWRPSNFHKYYPLENIK